MKQKEQLKELENMLNASAGNVENNVPGQGDIPELASEPGFEIDYDKLERKCNKQATTMLKNATGFMIGDELIKDNAYLKDKLKTDVISLGGMLYQLELMKTMQKSLSEEVRHGATSARMYEVFGQLSKAIAENNKQLLQTVEALKVTYLDIKENIIQFKESTQLALGNGTSHTADDGSTVSMSTRDLIEKANERKKKRLQAKEDIEDIEAEES